MRKPVIYVTKNRGRRMAFAGVLWRFEIAVATVPGQQHVLAQMTARRVIGPLQRVLVIGADWVGFELDDVHPISCLVKMKQSKCIILYYHIYDAKKYAGFCKKRAFIPIPHVSRFSIRPA